jgi:HlyD family secretion protein
MNPTSPGKPTLPTARSSPAKRRGRRWLPYAGAVVLVALIVAGMWPQPAPVETARAAEVTLRATVNEEGKTRIKQRFEVAAPVTGQLRRISLKPGADVQAGQTVLAVIEPVSPALLDARARSTAEAKRDTAIANVEKARAGHDFAASDLRRFEKLYTEKTVAIQELETVRWREASAARELAAAESGLRQAKAELAEFASNGKNQTGLNCDPVEVKAPVSGRVLRVFQESARVVTLGTPLLELGDPADLEVVIEVLSRDGAAIAPGAAVELEQWGGGAPLEARVRLVEPAAFTKVSALGVEEQRVNVIADLLTSPEHRRSLGDNFRVEAHIVLWATNQTLKVPAGALFRRGDQWAAFAVVGGHAQLRLVKAGRTSGTETQILEGLKEGDEVILYPGDRVHDGQRVKPVKI